MRRTRSIFLPVALTAIAAPLPALAQATFTTIDVPHYMPNTVYLSDDGRVIAGTACGDGDCMYYWTAETGVVYLGAYEFWSTADGIAADGALIVGVTGQQSAPDAALWDRKDFAVLGKPAGVAKVRGTQISGDGRVVFVSSDTSHVWRWTAEQGFTPLGDDVLASFYTVSPDGDAAAGSTFGGAAYWTEPTGLVPIGMLPGGSDGARALGMTPDASVIVGESDSSRHEAYREAFRWTPETGMVPLGVLPDGRAAASAGDVSADGRLIVAGGGGYVSPWNARACIWDPDHGLRDLNDLLPALGADLHGWTVTSALQISSDGRVIAGRALPPDDYVERVWIATLCPPDCTEDGRLNVNDFICFQSQWRQHTTYADYNRDGAYTVNDFLAYQADFRRGCP